MSNEHYCTSCNETLSLHADGSLACACDFLDADDPTSAIPSTWRITTEQVLGMLQANFSMRSTRRTDMKIVQIQTHVRELNMGREIVLHALSESGQVFEWQPYPPRWIPLPPLPSEPSEKATLDERLKRDAG